MPEKRLLTVREVARRCHRSEETVRRWIWSGKLPAKKLGNQLFVEEGELAPIQPGLRISESRAEYRARAGSKKELLKQTEEDGAFQDQLPAKHGPVDVVELITEPAPGLTERQYRQLEARERKLRKTLLERYGYFDVAELVRQSREGR